MLWVAKTFPLNYLTKFAAGLEILFAFSIFNGEKRHALKMPNLKVLVVEDIDEWSREMIRLNAGVYI
jgi:hypothetical protein